VKRKGDITWKALARACPFHSKAVVLKSIHLAVSIISSSVVEHVMPNVLLILSRTAGLTHRLVFIYFLQMYKGYTVSMKDTERDFIRMQIVDVKKLSPGRHIAIALPIQSVGITGFCCLRMKIPILYPVIGKLQGIDSAWNLFSFNNNLRVDGDVRRSFYGTSVK